jgi:hypothetical protein
MDRKAPAPKDETVTQVTDLGRGWLDPALSSPDDSRDGVVDHVRFF